MPTSKITMVDNRQQVSQNVFQLYLIDINYVLWPRKCFYK